MVARDPRVSRYAWGASGAPAAYADFARSEADMNSPVHNSPLMKLPRGIKPPHLIFTMGPDRCHTMVAEAAYYFSEHRGFAPGRELDDWLAAESPLDGATGPNLSDDNPVLLLDAEAGWPIRVCADEVFGSRRRRPFIPVVLTG
jgi:hypothetical protein